ncbi:mitochondrial uncoupling protein Bmcp [Diaphorina citri]|uniref:Mitochondrial uncoupling protein Bmcp n=1 Tax=Diaphorina citri TaxID=121845 RepID=A0A3Q0J3N3_DIACI|nr:mitochondrial uncoupling protein Bmcp [Diaphorina citri]
MKADLPYLILAREKGVNELLSAKTRLQVQGQQLDQQYAKLKYRGMTDVLLQISRKDGFWALYSGISPAVIRQATYGTIKFGTYYSLKNFIVEKTGQEDIVVNVGCAVAAGILASSIANPTDVVKVHMQNFIVEKTGQEDIVVNVGCAVAAGILASSIANPTDVVKVRMQVVHSNSLVTCLHDIYTKEGVGAFWKNFFLLSFQTRLMNQKHLKNQHVRVYKGSIDCMLQTIKHEGFMALYKGFIPTWVRMGPWNIIFFITYEQLKKHF